MGVYVRNDDNNSLHRTISLPLNEPFNTAVPLKSGAGFWILTVPLDAIVLLGYILVAQYNIRENSVGQKTIL